MNYLSKLCTILCLIIVLFTTCYKEETKIETKDDEIPQTITKLGEKLENPYTVENMQKALNNIQLNSKLK